MAKYFPPTSSARALLRLASRSPAPHVLALIGRAIKFALYTLGLGRRLRGLTEPPMLLATHATARTLHDVSLTGRCEKNGQQTRGRYHCDREPVARSPRGGSPIPIPTCIAWLILTAVSARTSHNRHYDKPCRAAHSFRINDLVNSASRWRVGQALSAWVRLLAWPPSALQ